MKLYCFVWMVIAMSMCAYKSDQGNISNTIFWALLSMLSYYNFKEAK